MLDPTELCRQIKQIHPEINQQDIQVEVRFDPLHNDWVIDLKLRNHHLLTYLDPDEADQCMRGQACASLNLQIDLLPDAWGPTLKLAKSSGQIAKR